MPCRARRSLYDVICVSVDVMEVQLDRPRVEEQRQTDVYWIPMARRVATAKVCQCTQITGLQHETSDRRSLLLVHLIEKFLLID